MGFIVFTATAIAFSVAAVISIMVGAVGITFYVWRGRSSPKTRRVFWYILIGSTLIGMITINVIPFQQAPAGSNYSEWLNEWAVKAIVYALIPGVGCLLGGAASILAQVGVNRKTDGR
jgi:hypothetical protein